MATDLLAGVTDLVAADGAEAAMVGARPFTTGPAEVATGVAIAFATDRTGGNTTSFAEQFLTTAALGKAGVANQMTVAIQYHLGHLVMADVTMRPL
jgi:hypothetical protein